MRARTNRSFLKQRVDLVARAAVLAIAAVGCSDAPRCDVGQKLCGERCVSADDPELGCGDARCEACELPAANAACDAGGRCVVAACELGRGDCDDEPATGCETDLATSDAHCGACGTTCAEGASCRDGGCVDDALAAFLDTPRRGFCPSREDGFVNLCGFVYYCFDSFWMRTFERGVAVDIGLEWDGTDRLGPIFEYGDDCPGYSLVALALEPRADGGTELVAIGPQASGRLVAPFAPGRHLVSFRATPSERALFVDGRLVARGARGGEPLRVGSDQCGPGITLGARKAYWWQEMTDDDKFYLAMSPFFFHLRDEAGALDRIGLEVVAPTDRTIALFDAEGADGEVWTSADGAHLARARRGHTWSDDLTTCAALAPNR
jgi:hypothetical protein